MKKIKFIILFSIVLLSNLVRAQFQFFKNYNINDGLPSNKIYNIIEDKYGFIWICTDQGVSRFDGIRFENFTTKDGLPDNEVLSLFEDHKGRIWFNSFSTEPCYYYNGRIYNSTKDSFLNRIKLHKPIGPCLSVIVQSNNSMAFYIHENGKKLLVGKEIADIVIKTKSYVQGFFFQNILYEDNKKYHLFSALEVLEWDRGDSVKLIKYRWPTVQLNYYKAPAESIFAFIPSKYIVEKINFKTNIKTEYKTDSSFNNLFVINDFCILSANKSYTIFDKNFDKIIEKVNLPFKFERICIDKKGNKWFGSFDKGLYFIRNQAPTFIDLKGDHNEGILSIVPDGNNLIINTEKNGLLSLDKFGECHVVLKIPTMNRVKGYAKIGNKQIVGTDEGLFKLTGEAKGPKLLKFSAIKDFEKTTENELLIGYSSGACIMGNSQTDSLKFIDWERTTAICRVSNSVIWLGGLNGIRKNTQNAFDFKSVKLKLNDEIDNSRILDIKSDKIGNMWVATDQNGLFCCQKNGTIVKFGESNNSNYKLLSDVCVQILISDNNTVWLATLNGISIINQSNLPNLTFNVNNFTISDGMPGKSIKNIAFWNTSIMVVTPQGLFEFKNFPKSNNQISKTLISNIKVNDKNFSQSKLKLFYNENSLIISYASSFINTNSEYSFKYRVKELSKNWIKTNNLEVPLLGLDPGAYTFEIAAINSHGLSGEITTFNFEIRQPWFKTIWFQIIILILLITAIFYFYNLTKQKIYMSKNLTLFRLRIMRAQMNPHFVFNALSNIQHLVQVKELEQADEYIVTLSGMMRNSIDYSGKEFITLDKEIDYTRNYLEIEKRRFEEKFDFEIHTDISVDEQAQFFVPPLILQPLVENAIKHAFKGLDKKGKIDIEIFKINETTIRYLITDNGVGFKYISNLSLNHSLDITKERLAILYKEMKKETKFIIQSSYSVIPTGTTIIIELPIINE